MRKYFPFIILIAILEMATIFLMGYTISEPYPMVYILISALFISTIILILLKNVKLAVPLIITFLAIEHLRVALPIFSNTSSFKTQMLIPLSSILVIFALICWLLFKSVIKDRDTSHQYKIGHSYLEILLTMLVAWGSLSILWSPEKNIGLYYEIKLLLNFFMYQLMVLLIKTEEDIKTTIRVWVLISVITGITMLISVLPTDSLTVEKIYTFTKDLYVSFEFKANTRRASGFTPHQNAADFLNIGILFSMGLLSQSKTRREKIMVISVIVLLSWALLNTQAKGPVAALLLGITFLIFTIKNFRAFLFRNLYIIAVCFIVLFGLYILSQLELMYLLGIKEMGIKESVPSRFLSSSQTSSALTLRLGYWEQVIRVVVRNETYINGLGIGGSKYYLLSTAPHLHNMYLAVLFDFGLIGFMLLLIIILVSIVKIFFLTKNLKDNSIKTILLSLSGCAITLGITLMMDFDYSYPILWALMGIGVAIYRYAIATQKQTVLQSVPASALRESSD